jgi:predicted enzyme related to lactoylglutathione lyase
MHNRIRYVHTNIVSKDWRRLADFYIKVFECTPLPPERNLSGLWLDRLTGMENVNIRGIHLSLPGYENGPTLEIFSYSPYNNEIPPPGINRKGFAHIAFHVDSVERVLGILLENGGSRLGDVVRKDYGNMGILTAVYASDPEGNFIEIQNWEEVSEDKDVTG